MKKVKRLTDDEIWEIVNKDRCICLICFKRYEHLGSHIWHGHKITAREYKSMFGLPYNMSLISDEIKEKKSKIASWQKTWIENFKKGKKYRWKPLKRPPIRITPFIKRKWIQSLLKKNEKMKTTYEQCPVCKIRYKHMESHLYNKHGLIFVKKLNEDHRRY